MPKLRVHNFSISLDGYVAGPEPFHFVDDGIEAALERALDAAGGNDVRIGGGAATVQQYLRAGLIDDLHLVIVPILLSPLPLRSSSTVVVEKLLARDAGEPRLELFG